MLVVMAANRDRCRLFRRQDGLESNNSFCMNLKNGSWAPGSFHHAAELKSRAKQNRLATLPLDPTPEVCPASGVSACLIPQSAAISFWRVADR